VPVQDGGPDHPEGPGLASSLPSQRRRWRREGGGGDKQTNKQTKKQTNKQTNKQSKLLIVCLFVLFVLFVCTRPLWLLSGLSRAFLGLFYDFSEASLRLFFRFSMPF